MYIFVYGSLRQKGQNHWLLDHDIYKGLIKTKHKYYMISPKSKTFPYCSSQQIIPNSEPTEIQGELYDVCPKTLKMLDALEGHPSHYTRKTIELENNILADTYLLENDTVIQELRNSGRFMAVPQGDWIKFLDST